MLCLLVQSILVRMLREAMNMKSHLSRFEIVKTLAFAKGPCRQNARLGHSKACLVGIALTPHLKHTSLKQGMYNDENRQQAGKLPSTARVMTTQHVCKITCL